MGLVAQTEAKVLVSLRKIPKRELTADLDGRTCAFIGSSRQGLQCDSGNLVPMSDDERLFGILAPSLRVELFA